MQLSSEYQLAILQYLAKSYACRPPETIEHDLTEICDGDQLALDVNLYYLLGEGFIENNCLSSALGQSKPSFCYKVLKLTNKGAKTVCGDDKLITLQNYVTIRLHSDILALIETHLQDQVKDETCKQQIIQKLRSMPASLLETLFHKIVDLGLDNWQSVFRLMQG